MNVILLKNKHNGIYIYIYVLVELRACADDTIVTSWILKSRDVNAPEHQLYQVSVRQQLSANLFD